MVRKLKRKAGWKATRVTLSTAVLVEIGPTHPAWHSDALPQRVAGSIVKLVPPPGTPESTVLAMEQAFYQGGAASVKVMPVQEELRITVEGEEFDFTKVDDTRPLRQVAVERCDRVTNAYDSKALKALVGEAMDYAEAQS